MFYGQVVATAVAGTVQLGVQAWMFTNIPDICATNQKDGFICPSTEVFGTASIIVRCCVHRVMLTDSDIILAISGGLLDLLSNSQRDKYISESS